MNKQIIAVIFGGESAEHDISIMSAINMASAIDKRTYDVLYWYISKTGIWYEVNAIRSYADTSNLCEIIPQLGTGVVKNLQNGTSIRVDILFPVLHGPNGEDGSVQGLAQLLHIPIVGCDMLSAALCMNKTLTKQIAHTQSVPIVPYIELRRDENVDYVQITKKLGSAMFIKPVDQGSSVGVNKAQTEDELLRAVQLARAYSDAVLIEQAIVGREIELAVLQEGNMVRVSMPGEIVPDGEFYSYDSKYGATSNSQAIIPAVLDEGVADQLKAYAETTFRALQCRGLARIDFFVTQENEIYLNEVNTMPGFTDISMYPKLLQVDGYSTETVINSLINAALAKIVIKAR